MIKKINHNHLSKRFYYTAKEIIKKIPIVFHFLKIIQDKRYFYHFLQGLITDKNLRFFLRKIESKLFYRKNNKLYNQFINVNNEINYLKKYGFVENPLKISNSQVNKIVNFLKTKPIHDPEQSLLGYFSYNDRPRTVKRGFYKCEDVIFAPDVLNIANNPKLISIAFKYFKAIPSIDYIGAWWSFPSDSIALTQSFHRDIDTLNSLKFFVYLTNVDYKSGPHVYVSGSHNSSHKTSKGRQHNDSDLEKNFGNKDIVYLKGNSGYSFLADTFGFHKGLVPERSERLVLQIIYTLKSTPFGPKKPFINKDDAIKLISNKYSNYINKNIIKI
tara:strand:- start:6329 stop:7315 length:987 start_codon:yes stop_codon:yes gene_type:complete